MPIISRTNLTRFTHNLYQAFINKCYRRKVASYSIPIQTEVNRSSLSYVPSIVEKLKSNLVSANQALESPLVLSEPEQKLRSSLKIAFALGTAALASVALTACSGDISPVVSSISSLVHQGIEFIRDRENLGTIISGLTCFSLASKLSLEFEFIRRIRPLHTVANFGRKLLPYTLIPTGIMAFGWLKNNFLELGLLASLGLTFTSVVTNISTRFGSFKEFRNNHPTLARWMLVSNNLWKVGLFSSALFGGIFLFLFTGSNDPSSFHKATELFRYIEGAKELVSLFWENPLAYRELTLPITLATAVALHQAAIHLSDRLPAQSTLRWLAEKYAFWGILSYPAFIAGLAYLSIINNSTFSQVFSAWSPEVKNFLLDTTFLGVAGLTYRDIKNSLYTRLGKEFAPSEAAVVIEHILAKAQKTGKFAMLSILTPMFISLVAKFFSQDYSLFNDWTDILWNLSLTSATAYFAFNYVMVAAVHSTGHSWGAIVEGERSVDATEEPRVSDSFVNRSNREGDGMRVLAASMVPQATALVQYPKMLVNPVANIEFGDYIEQHPQDKFDQMRVVRAHYEWTELVIKYQQEAYQFIQRTADEFHYKIANKTLTPADLPKYYRVLAAAYHTLGRRYTKDVKEFGRKYNDKDFQPGDGSDFKARPSYQAVLRFIEREDKKREIIEGGKKNRNDCFFERARDPWRYALDEDIRICGQEMLSTSRELIIRAAEKIELNLAKLEAEFKYLGDKFSVPFFIAIRHVIKQDERNFNKISNLATPHTFEGDTLYEIWTITPNRDGQNPVDLPEEEIPSLYILIRNPYCTHNPHENKKDPMKKYLYFWVHRDNFLKALKYSGSWSNEIDHVDNTPEDFGEKKETITINHQTLEAYPAMEPKPLPFRKLIYRTLTPSQIREEEQRFRWVCEQTLSDEEWETFRIAFEAWAIKRFGPDYKKWIEGRRKFYNNPRELWYKPEPGFKFYLGSTVFDDPKEDTLDEEHLSINFRMEAQIQKDTEENAVIRVPYYYPITRRMENPAPNLGIPRLTYVTDYHFDLTYELEDKKHGSK